MSGSKNVKEDRYIIFRLNADDDGWPPVGAESLPVNERSAGVFEVLKVPIFVADISVEDQIRPLFDDEGYVIHWKHQKRSKRSTIWIAKGEALDLSRHLTELIKIGCSIETLSKFQLNSVDVPEHIEIDALNDVLDRIEDDGGFLAYPSLRHELD